MNSIGDKSDLCINLKCRNKALVRGELAIVVILVSGIGTPRPQSAIDSLQPLVEISARRLAIAGQVALAKWDSHAAVEDAPREAQVITSAVKDGELKDLDRTSVSNFFRAQIDWNQRGSRSIAQGPVLGRSW